MEKYAELAASSQFACTILGNVATWDILLLPCPFRPPDLAEQMAERGLAFMGVCALVNGEPRSKFAQELGPEMLQICSLSFLREIERWLAEATPTPETDVSEQFLWDLWSLQDPRS